MDLVSGYKGMVGLVFGNENSDSNVESYIERLLIQISNGSLAKDRRSAIDELQSIVAENHTAQLAIGATGFPVLLAILKEERGDVEMVRVTLETLVSSLTPIKNKKGSTNEILPDLMNADLLSQEVENISLFLSLLLEEDFYMRYYTLQILTILLTNSPSRLQEAILSVPRGITRLMDMLDDREAIRNESLLLLTYLTRDAEEIQKICVFEGAFEKIFSIIREEGVSDGGIVVQDCLELLNNLLRGNSSNQTLLRETIGFDGLISILKHHRIGYRFTQQKKVNLMGVLETIKLLTMEDLRDGPGKDTSKQSNKASLVQKEVLDPLLFLGLGSKWAPVSVRCGALRCIGNLISDHPKNCDALASKLVGEEPRLEPALNCIFQVILETSSLEEFVSADHVLKKFCEGNHAGQLMLSSRLIRQPFSATLGPFEQDAKLSFGSMLLNGLTLCESDGDLETCGRTASVLSHILKDNEQCKERVLQIELTSPSTSLNTQEPLMHHVVKYLAISWNIKNKGDSKKRNPYLQLIILKLLVTWLAGCPAAVRCFLDSHPHLTLILELVSSPLATACECSLAAVLLGECIMYNKSTEREEDARSVVDAISRKVGVAQYLMKLDEMFRAFPFSDSEQPKASLAPSAAAGVEEIKDGGESSSDKRLSDEQQEKDLTLLAIFDDNFIKLLKQIAMGVRDAAVHVYSHAKSLVVARIPAEMDQKSGEKDGDYIKRLKSFVELQCSEILNLVVRNRTLAEDLSKISEKETFPDGVGGGSSTERALIEMLQREINEASLRIKTLETEKMKLEEEAATFCDVSGKMESDLKSLSDAYNLLEETSLQLENELKARKSEEGAMVGAQEVEAIKAEAKEEAEKESEAELNDLLVCLGQEQSKVEKLSARLLELGEDVDKLLEDIGEDGEEEDTSVT